MSAVVCCAVVTIPTANSAIPLILFAFTYTGGNTVFNHSIGNIYIYFPANVSLKQK